MAKSTSTSSKLKAANAPVFKSRVGHVTVSVWSNNNKDGEVFYSSSIQKSYKDDQDKWQNTDSLSPSDMLSARKALDKAHDFILEQYEAD